MLRSRLAAAASLACICLSGLLTSGCQLAVDFDRDRLGDTGTGDSGGGFEDGGPEDGGSDSGELDAGDDGGPTDAGPIDAGPMDGGPVDGGPVDGGPVDGGPMDGGPMDAGPMDAGPMDAGPMDAGPMDAGPMDAGPMDAGPMDAGPMDAGCTLDTECDDGSMCTTNTCVTGSCVSTAITCVDSNPCTDDTCSPVTGCVFTNNTAACDDGDMCTTTDVCGGGTCAGTPRVCVDGNVCTDDTCDPSSGLCAFPNNAATCDDSDACTVGEACASGTCGGGATQGALMVVDDGSGASGAVGLPDLVISEVAPGAYIELYNTTGTAIALSGVAHNLCSPFDYAALSTLAAGITVPANGYAVVPWPVGFSDTDAAGEMMLYRSASFAINTDILDYVCWGAITPGRLGQATAVGKWSGACAGAITGGAIHRLASTDGTTLASYDVAAGPSSAHMCVP